MNWDAIGASAELFGAVAVFASLVYLAIQVRQSAGVDRAAAFQTIFDGVTRHNNFMFGPENVDLVIRALKSYNDLSAPDRMCFDVLMTNLLNYFEASALASNEKILGEDTMENWAWWFETKIFSYPGPAEWWTTGQLVYPPEIRKWIDRRIEKADPSSDYFGLLEDTDPAR